MRFQCHKIQKSYTPGSELTRHLSDWICKGRETKGDEKISCISQMGNGLEPEPVGQLTGSILAGRCSAKFRKDPNWSTQRSFVEYLV